MKFKTVSYRGKDWVSLCAGEMGGWRSLYSANASGGFQPLSPYADPGTSSTSVVALGIVKEGGDVERPIFLDERGCFHGGCTVMTRRQTLAFFRRFAKALGYELEE